MSYTIRPATGIDCIDLRDRMTEADRYELELTPGNPLEKLFVGIRVSLNPIVIDDKNGELAALAGVVPFDSQCIAGSPWMLCTHAAGTEPLSFVKQAKVWVAEQQKQFQHLEHKVYRGNKHHIKFLEVLGFIILPAPAHSLYRPFFL